MMSLIGSKRSKGCLVHMVEPGCGRCRHTLVLALEQLLTREQVLMRCGPHAVLISRVIRLCASDWRAACTSVWSQADSG